MSVLGTRVHYKPFEFEWAFSAYKKQQQAHWLPEEVPMKEDVDDYDHKLTEGERRVVTQLLRLFTQMDLDVSSNYIDNIIGRFHLPEIRMMLSAFSSMESVHAQAYAYLSDSLNLDRDANFYAGFMDVPAMRAKHEYLDSLSTDNLSISGLAKRLAIFGGFVEGVQLFSSFAILNSFPRRNLMKGTGQIITWSIRDESLHASSIIKLFRTIVEEHPRIWNDAIKGDLYTACEKAVALEDAFIDVCFDLGDITGLKSADVKHYVRYMANIRLGEMGLKPKYEETTNPFLWLDAMLQQTHTNFFENRETSYSKGLIRDDLPSGPIPFTRGQRIEI